MRNQIKGGLFMACVGCGAFGLLLAAGSARADMDQPASADTVSVGTTPTGKNMSATRHEMGSVVAIDRTARTMTIKNAAGDKDTIDVPAEVAYFDKLKLGDKVALDYHESMAISMLPAGTKPSSSERATMMKTGKGAGVIGKQMQVSAEVVAVDAANNEVTFKGPHGHLRTVSVQDPDMQQRLQTLKPGQVVQFTYTEATAAAIAPAGN
jgi:hypothetical protein